MSTKRRKSICAIGGRNGRQSSKGNLKENNCKLLIKQQTPVQLWSPFNPEMSVLECMCAHNFSACVTLQELKQTWLKHENGKGQRVCWEESFRQGPLVLKDGRGSGAGVSPVTTSWVTEHDPFHLEPITQFLTTSWNTSIHFLHPSTPTMKAPTYPTPPNSVWLFINFFYYYYFFHFHLELFALSFTGKKLFQNIFVWMSMA